MLYFRTKEEEGSAQRKLFLINQIDTLDSSVDEENVDVTISCKLLDFKKYT